jgi:hypothetical protein
MAAISLGSQLGEVGDVAFAHVGAVAIGLAEVDGLVGFAVGGGPGGAGDIHVHIIKQKTLLYKDYFAEYACLHN